MGFIYRTLTMKKTTHFTSVIFIDTNYTSYRAEFHHFFYPEKVFKITEFFPACQKEFK